MLDLLTDHTFRTVLLGTCLIGAVSGTLGCFAYLRKQSLASDMIAHSSLFGITLFFLASYWITGQGNKSLFILVPGAIFSGIAAMTLSRLIVDHSRVRQDSGLGVMLAIFFGSGLVLLRWIQQAEPAIPGRRGLQDYLFGMAAALTKSDLVMITILGVVAAVILLFSWNALKVFTFDKGFSCSLGFRSQWLELILNVLLVIGVVIGLQVVGVILMIALLIAPAAAARQWTSTLGQMVFVAATIGVISSGTGTIISSVYQVPTGPAIVLAATSILLISIVIAPRRGLLMQRRRRKKYVGPNAERSISGASTGVQA